MSPVPTITTTTSSIPPALTGSCACKRIHYISTSLPTSLINCHCTECRKASGSPYQTWTRNKLSDITWSKVHHPPSSSSKVEKNDDNEGDSDHPEIRQSSPYATRGFCSHCGSSMYMRYHRSEPEMIGLAAGTIDEGSVVKGGQQLPMPMGHIFLKEKASWFVLPDDGLERWEGFSEDMKSIYKLE